MSEETGCPGCAHFWKVLQAQLEGALPSEKNRAPSPGVLNGVSGHVYRVRACKGLGAGWVEGEGCGWGSQAPSRLDPPLPTETTGSSSLVQGTPMLTQDRAGSGHSSPEAPAEPPSHDPQPRHLFE